MPTPGRGGRGRGGTAGRPGIDPIGGIPKGACGGGGRERGGCFMEGGREGGRG